MERKSSLRFKETEPRDRRGCPLSACSRTSRGSITSPKPRSDPASPSREKPNSSLPAKPWKASKPTASSQIPLTPGSRSPRSLSLLPHQSENVLPIKRTLNRLKNDLNRSPESTLVRIGHLHTRQTLRDQGGTAERSARGKPRRFGRNAPYVVCCGARVRLARLRNPAMFVLRSRSRVNRAYRRQPISVARQHQLARA